MKIINNAFSTKMLQQDCNIKFSIISEQEFRDALTDKQNKIVIGHEDTANYFNCVFNRQTVHLKKRDVLYVCELNNETGGRLPAGTQFIEELGNGVYFRFCKIEVQ